MNGLDGWCVFHGDQFVREISYGASDVRDTGKVKEVLTGPDLPERNTAERSFSRIHTHSASPPICDVFRASERMSNHVLSRQGLDRLQEQRG